MRGKKQKIQGSEVVVVRFVLESKQERTLLWTACNFFVADAHSKLADHKKFKDFAKDFGTFIAHSVFVFRKKFPDEKKKFQWLFFIF